MDKKDKMEALKIIIGQGNGLAGMTAATHTINYQFPEHKDFFLVYSSQNEVIEAARQYHNCIVLLGNIWGGQVSGIDVALKVREANESAKIYQYSIFPSNDPGKVFDGTIQKNGGAELVSFLQKVLQLA